MTDEHRSKTLMEIELHPAAFFDCDECGIENLVRSVSSSCVDDEFTEACADFGNDNDCRMAHIRFPEVVECYYCGAEFTAKYDT